MERHCRAAVFGVVVVVVGGSFSFRVVVFALPTLQNYYSYLLPQPTEISSTKINILIPTSFGYQFKLYTHVV